MSLNPTIYVVTNYEFNHTSARPGAKPIDARFLESDHRYVYYLIDKTIPEPLRSKEVILENDLDQDLYVAGGKFLAEWTFLLAEEKHAFCTYPFFMVSSRFYEKNRWLIRNLNEEWDKLFGYFENYGWGFLPSYDRPLRWIDLEWESQIKAEAWNHTFFPYTEKTYSLTKQVFGVDIPNDYRYTADLFCNYIGFRSRKELLEYTSFYRPLIDYFFDDKYSLKRDFSPYIRKTGGFRNEKPFTFFLELLTHLYFFSKKEKYFALHYDGYYELDEAKKSMQRLEKIQVPFSLKCERAARWHWRRLNTETRFGSLRKSLSEWSKR